MRKHARSLVQILTQHFGVGNVRFGAEVGVWRGELSADLLRTFPELCLVMVDLWKPFGDSAMHNKDNNASAMLEALEDAKRNTSFAKGRSIIVHCLSEGAATDWEDEEMNFVFVDADHFYESVRADLHAWWSKVQSNGIMAGHDYNGMGDRRKGWGVKRAVDEFFGAMGITVHVEPGRIWWVSKSNLEVTV